MIELQTDSFVDFHDPADGKSYYLVTLEDGTVKQYEFVTAVSMRSYRNIYGALDNPGAYTFSDHDGVLVIQPREVQS